MTRGEKRKAYLKKYRKKYRKGLKIQEKQYRDAHKEERKRYAKKYRQKNKVKIIRDIKRYKITHPWMLTYDYVWHRCNRVKSDSYPRYGGREIKLEMVPNDFKILWFFYAAWQMKKPSIARRDHDKDYTLDNCYYKEFADHLKDKKRHRIIKKQILRSLYPPC